MTVKVHPFSVLLGIWCPEPQPPDQGFVMGIGRQYGDRIRYACRTGYKLNGQSESLCQADGNWSAPVPDCQGNVIQVSYKSSRAIVDGIKQRFFLS